ncbi:MAG: DUF3380 domain-containing protein [Chloroflexi bacterium]|nr:DUF3380 domain-containing protein [Chloroflexota bacterium]
MPNQSGKTTSSVNFRSAPEVRPDTILRGLAANTSVEVTGEQGEWYTVIVGGQNGFIKKEFILLASQGVAAGFLVHRMSEFASVPLPAPDTDRVEVVATMSGTEKLAANIWNKFGGLLNVLSAELKIDPAVAVAVFAVESGGRGFGDDGRTLIRFENHIFYNYWGKTDPDRFNQFFKFDQGQTWQGHQWRPSVDQNWRDFHGRQTAEWEAFSFATTLNDTAAKSSISMGSPQIMGFNFSGVGYESVQQMFDAFASGDRAQVIGFFDFVQGPSTNSRRVLALQANDFNTFASMYNGPGQASQYGGLIQNTLNAFHKIKPNIAPPTPAPPPTPPAPSPSADIVTALFDSLTRRDLDSLMNLYQTDVAHVTSSRTVQGANLVRDFYLELLSRLGDAKFSVSSVQDAAPTKIIAWTATGSGGSIGDGQDTLSVAGGKIQYHFTKFTVN